MPGTKTILVVDDDENLVSAMKMTLESAGYKVECAYDGDEALARAHEIHPDLVVLDIMMPKKHGFDVCKILRRESDTSNIPVIILTAVGEHIDESHATREYGMTLEAEDFIEKPIKPSDLLSRIAELIG